MRWLFDYLAKFFKTLFSLPCFFPCVLFIHLWNNIILIFLSFNLSIQIIFFKKRNLFVWVCLFISRILKHYFFCELNEKTRNFWNTLHHSDHEYIICYIHRLEHGYRNNWSFSTVHIIHFFHFEITHNLEKKICFSMLSICLTISQLFRVVLLYLISCLQRIKEK